MRKYMSIIILMILVSSIYAVHAQDNNVKVVSNILGTNRTHDKEIVVVNITTGNTGNLSYAEGYYSLDKYGNLRLDGSSKIVTKNNTDVLIVKVLRPMMPDGKPYSRVKAVVIDDGNVIFKGFYDLNDKYKNDNEIKKSPGIGMFLITMSIISAIYLLKMKKN